MSLQADQSLVKTPGKNGVDPVGPKYDEMLVSEIQRRLDKVSLVQEELAGSREELLIERERLRSLGMSLHAQRVETGNAEAAFMSTLRRIFNERREEMPPVLVEAYSAVEAARDKLGVMDEDYLQAEQTLSGSEWTYMDRENETYQFDFQRIFTDLFDIKTPSHIDQHPQAHSPLTFQAAELESTSDDMEEDYQNARAELDSFREQFKSLRVQQSRSFDLHELPKVYNAEAMAGPISNPETPSQSSDILGNLIDSEVRFHRLKSTLENRRKSDPMQVTRSSMIPDIQSQAQTDSAIPALPDDSGFRDWLFEYWQSNWIANHQQEGQEHLWQQCITDTGEQAYVLEQVSEIPTKDDNAFSSFDDFGFPNTGLNNEFLLPTRSMTSIPSGQRLASKHTEIYGADEMEHIPFDSIPSDEPINGYKVNVPGPVFRSVVVPPPELPFYPSKPSDQFSLHGPSFPAQATSETNSYPPVRTHHWDMRGLTEANDKLSAGETNKRDDSMDPCQRTSTTQDLLEFDYPVDRKTKSVLRQGIRAGPISRRASNGFLFVGDNLVCFPKARSERSFPVQLHMGMKGHSRARSTPAIFFKQYMPEQY